MGVHLTSRKIAQIQAATAIMLSPFSYESGDDWRRAVCEAIAPIVDACGVIFGLSLPDEQLLGGQPDVVRVLAPFMPPSGWLRDGYLRSLRARGESVFDWREAYPPKFLKKTDFYNEVVSPNRLFAPLILAADIPRTPLGAATFSYFENESRADERAEERKGLMQLLVPVFEAGVAAYVVTRHQRDSLISFGELSNVALALFDLRGRV